MTGEGTHGVIGEETHGEVQEVPCDATGTGVDDGTQDGTYESSREHTREEVGLKSQVGIRVKPQAEDRAKHQAEDRAKHQAEDRAKPQAEARAKTLAEAQLKTQAQTREPYLLECVRLASDGTGVGYIDGLVTFVPGLLQGETGLVRIEERKKHFLRGELVKVMKAAAVRQDPPCPVFHACGGCQLQHMNYEETLLWKNRWVQDALARVGKVHVRVEPVLGMDFPWRYRNKVTLHRDKANASSGGKPTRGNAAEGTGTQAVLGYYQNRSHTTVAFHDCLLLSERMNSWIRAVSRVIDDFPGIEDVTLRESDAGEGLFLIKDSRSGKGSTFAVKRAFFPEVGSALATRAGDTPLRLWGQETLEVSFLGVHFRVSPLAFLQVNYIMAEKLYSLVRQFAGLTGKEHVWDLYSGVGTLSLIVAGCAHDVYGIEENPFAVEDARRNADLNGFKHVQFLQGKVEDNLPRLPLRPDVVIMDPPRAGVTAAVIDHILRSRPGKIIYVSCDPATLARDLSRIVRGEYQVSLVQPVDMFPWTRHVETVTCIVNKNR
ncbi:23S rRNA (uracil-C(5))-methyltransferase RlmCD [Peptococcaceae bacterium CEB3]|nr:23S rRNA (uracil-C(5))-methyltransferase RlmCD [Peptococcaceae bacterium CEB3]